MRMISVVDKNWGVGREEALLFYIPTDMRFFKKTTTGNVVVMGKNTLHSFPGQRPLKDRVNIVLSKEPLETEGIVQCRSMDELMEEIGRHDPDSVFLIGGASMYDQLMDCCTEALITQVDAIGDADRSIQSLDEKDGWELVEVSDPVEDNGFRFVFTKYINHDVKAAPTPLEGMAEAAQEDAAQETAVQDTAPAASASEEVPAEEEDSVAEEMLPEEEDSAPEEDSPKEESSLEEKPAADDPDAQEPTSEETE